MSALKERPILFSAPMVQALLAGRKTQTRRAIKPAPISPCPHRPLVSFNHGTPEYSFGRDDVTAKGNLRWWRCPYGQPGDRLWVRENFAYFGKAGTRPVAYRADTPEGERVRVDAPWKPSIHMPRWASRLTPEVTDVRLEHLQDIREGDALAEGIKHWGDGFHWEANSGWPGEPKGMESMRLIGKTAVDAYLALWEEINGRESLDANPWVWAVSFKVISDAPAAG